MKPLQKIKKKDGPVRIGANFRMTAIFQNGGRKTIAMQRTSAAAGTGDPKATGAPAGIAGPTTVRKDAA